ncbi:MBL fold metallo-hydrolase [Stenotrophomonas sp. STM01]|uniref:MBL fold metallo-hydrolase n=1 Tax=Stenotrophomonas sp. STM01 TaxID=2769278 RepID=UPI00177AE444|nr:MBL fold metallo-hydrolase [Stenotrophomonas sp. STM01]MBD9535131.1 MBL fold metallo-hydrolase [Stenotrophomonas sp. STM01]
MSDAIRLHPQVEPFFDKDTGTFTYVVYEGEGGAAAIIDPVLDYEPAGARISTASADALLAFVRGKALQVTWILETHAHADHLSAAGYLADILQAQVAIGRGIVQVQERFKVLFGLGEEFIADGRQFDRLLVDGDQFAIGALPVRVIATPGHTDDGLTYVIGDAAFIGDTLFAADSGTARTDFPGGDAHRLFASIQKILALPADTRIFLCHDYPGTRREAEPLTSIAAQRAGNAHLKDGVDESAFVQLRQQRDATLPVPRLILPALQVNIRGGRLPEPDANGVRYFRLPLDQMGDAR